MYSPLIEILKKIDDPNITKVKPVDIEISDIQALYNVYAIYPSIVFTQGGKSCITEVMWERWQGQPIYSPYWGK